MALRMAFTGTGHISQTHAQAARRLPGVELAAVVNHRAGSMADFAARFGIPRRYESLDALLADGGVDALSINTPNTLHAPQAIRALEAGLHVLVEKPMAVNAREAEQMLRASQKSGAKLMVAHCWRFDEEVRWLKEQVEAGRLGRILRTKGFGVHVNWGPGGWFVQSRLAGGGALADMGIHAIDAARFLLGDPLPRSVYAKISTEYGDYDVDDSGTIWINWENGAVSLIESGWWWPNADGPEAHTQLYGRSGFGQVFPTRLQLVSPDRQESEIVDPGYPPVREPHCPQAMYDRQMAAFVDCIREDGVPLPGGMEGLVNMKIVDAAYQSSQSGAVVPIEWAR